MRCLILVNTPAHAHLYRNLVPRLRVRGHEVRLLARDYACTLDLLDYFDLPYRSYGACETSRWSLFRRLPRHFVNVAREARQFGPDVVFGMGSYAAVAGATTGGTTVLVLDSEPTSLDHAVSRPAADAFLTPAAFRKDLGDRHYVFEGFKECAYLHPSVYTPEDVRDALGVGDDRYCIVRLNAFGSHHDVSEGGFSTDQRRRLVSALAEHCTVLVSDEGEDLALDSLPARPFDLHPARLHDALHGAALLVADTQTMVTEAALLGTPAVRSNSFVGDDDMGNFLELERRGLVENVDEFEAVVEWATMLAADPDATERWRRRRDDYAADLVDLTSVLVRAAEETPDLDAVSGLTPWDRTGRALATPSQ
jgi:predicted glycosyltransferase